MASGRIVNATFNGKMQGRTQEQKRDFNPTMGRYRGHSGRMKKRSKTSMHLPRSPSAPCFSTEGTTGKSYQPLTTQALRHHNSSRSSTAKRKKPSHKTRQSLRTGFSSLIEIPQGWFAALLGGSTTPPKRKKKSSSFEAKKSFDESTTPGCPQPRAKLEDKKSSIGSEDDERTRISLDGPKLPRKKPAPVHIRAWSSGGSTPGRNTPYARSPASKAVQETQKATLALAEQKKPMRALSQSPRRSAARQRLHAHPYAPSKRKRSPCQTSESDFTAWMQHKRQGSCPPKLTPRHQTPTGNIPPDTPTWLPPNHMKRNSLTNPEEARRYFAMIQKKFEREEKQRSPSLSSNYTTVTTDSMLPTVVEVNPVELAKAQNEDAENILRKHGGSAFRKSQRVQQSSFEQTRSVEPLPSAGSLDSAPRKSPCTTRRIPGATSSSALLNTSNPNSNRNSFRSASESVRQHLPPLRVGPDLSGLGSPPPNNLELYSPKPLPTRRKSARGPPGHNHLLTMLLSGKPPPMTFSETHTPDSTTPASTHGTPLYDRHSLTSIEERQRMAIQQRSVTRAIYRRELAEILEKRNRKKLKTLDEILFKYEVSPGGLHGLYTKICNKYQIEQKPEPYFTQAAEPPPVPNFRHSTSGGKHRRVHTHASSHGSSSGIHALQPHRETSFLLEASFL